MEVSDIDGHNIDTVTECLKKVSRPHLIFAHAVKGKGVSFMKQLNGMPIGQV